MIAPMINTLTILLVVTLAIPIGLAGLNRLGGMGIKHVQRRHLQDLCRGCLALTYDDGPGTAMTPLLVELLLQHRARATFFLVGFRAQRSPAMSDLLRRAGHEIGSHTHMHRDAWRVWPWTAWNDVLAGMQLSGPLSMSRKAPLFRPPFGHLTLWTWLAASIRGAKLCWWTIDSGDTHSTLPDPASIARQIVEAGGGVVLLHSHDRGEDRQRHVLAVTDRLLRAARLHGLRVCTMSELLTHAAKPFESQGEAHVREA
jgi:peptidoglycan-N-acetylglucosamine deacetylase